MNATTVYSFILGLSVGLTTAFLLFGKFWLGVIAGIPIGIACILAIIIFLLAWVDAEAWWQEDWFHEDDGTGDGYRN